MKCPECSDAGRVHPKCQECRGHGVVCEYPIRAIILNGKEWVTCRCGKPLKDKDDSFCREHRHHDDVAG